MGNHNKRHEHFELDLDVAMGERGYHPGTQHEIWSLIGRKAISCEAMLDMITVLDGDQARHEQNRNLGQEQLFGD